MSLINKLKIIDLTNNCLIEHVTDDNKITPGQALAGMIINGLGFTNHPLYLTPKFFDLKAIEQLFGKGIEAKHFNSHKLGRTLDQIYDYGCEKLFYEISVQVCAIENIDNRFLSLDTTSISVDGEYDVNYEEDAARITHGYSKDHRPDLKQIMVEMVCSQDAGVPLMMKCWSGNESDNKIFKARADEMLKIFKESQTSRYLVADSKLYTKDNAESLKHLNFITRIPATIKLEQELIEKAIENNKWTQLNQENRYSLERVKHYDIEQNWIIVQSDQARNRSQKTLNKQIAKENTALLKQIKSLKSQQYHCELDAKKAVDKLFKKIKYHSLINHEIVFIKEKEYKVSLINFEPNTLLIQATIEQRSCFVLSSNALDLAPEEVIAAYKRQNASVERGFRFLKSPTFFADSLFLKKPSRIEALIMIMVLSLLVFSITQRRLRASLKHYKQTIPNQINKAIVNPTAKWAFFLLEGIHVIFLNKRSGIQKVIQGIDELKFKIIQHLGQEVMQVYGLLE